MSRRSLLPAVVLGVLVSTAGCTHLGVGTDHGAKTNTVTYAVSGHGVTTVSYAAEATAAMTTRKDVDLPFSVTVHTVDHSLTKYEVSATASQDALTCTISVNGFVTITETSAAGQPVMCSFVK